MAVSVKNLYSSAFVTSLPPTFSALLLPHCARVRCEPDWHLGADWAPRLRDYDLWFVWSGRGHLRTTDGEIPLAPGVCLWMRPGRSYEATHDRAAPLGVNFFHFTVTTPRRFTPPVELLTTTHPDFAYALMRRILALRAKPEPAAQASAQRLFNALLAELVRETLARLAAPAAGLDAHHTTLMRRLAAEIREQPATPHTVATLARRAGYGVYHFSRVFQRIHGQRPRDFIIDARLSRARHLLAETSLSISQIAEALGFQNVFFFSRQFRQKTGVAPTAYRRSLPTPS